MENGRGGRGTERPNLSHGTILSEGANGDTENDFKFPSSAEPQVVVGNHGHAGWISTLSMSDAQQNSV